MDSQPLSRMLAPTSSACLLALCRWHALSACPHSIPLTNIQIILEPMGGVLCPERCIAAHLAGAAAAGAEVLYGAAVTRWGVEPGGQVSVQAGPDAQTHTADRLILAPGAWLPRLVPELKARRVLLCGPFCFSVP